MPEEAKPRKRLSPELRQSKLLDCAAEIVSADGVAAVTMERVAKEAQVSKSLVYVYFSSITELLRALLRRELKQLRLRQIDAAKLGRTFSELIREVTHAYLMYIEEHGLLIHRLQSEPSVAQGTDNPTDFSRDAAVMYFADVVCENFDIPMELAVPAASIAFGLPTAAGNYLDYENADLATIEDLTVAMIIGSVESLRNNYATMLKPIKRKPMSPPAQALEKDQSGQESSK